MKTPTPKNTLFIKKVEIQEENIKICLKEEDQKSKEDSPTSHSHFLYAHLNLATPPSHI